MPGPDPTVASVRRAVRGALGDAGDLVLVACSGGPDSLALAAAVAFEAPRAGVRAGAVVVDHGLQPDSALVAEDAAAACRDLGLDPVVLTRVDVDDSGSGPEAAARDARYAALEEHADRLDAAAILLGHTRDDQAEQVLLGLLRGAGTRSLAGIPPRRGRLVRPLLALTRSTTLAACAAEGLTPWSDPQNADPRFTRVRARDLVAGLEERLGPGVGAALARSAAHLREDADALDADADRVIAALGPPPWAVADLAPLTRAVRVRVLRRGCAPDGVRHGVLTAAHLDAVDALVTAWHGQGPVSLPGGGRVRRRAGHLEWEAADPGARDRPDPGERPGSLSG